MGAFSGGGTKARRRSKDQERARNLKNEARLHGRCPICRRMVANVSMYAHISAHARGADSQ